MLSRDSERIVKNAVKRREINGEYADNATIETYERAVSSGDITNQVACCRILQQRCGQLSDRLVVDVEDSRRLDDSHRLQAKRIAALITSGRMLLPATFTPVTETIDIQPVVCADNDDNAISDDTLDNTHNTDDNTIIDNDLQSQQSDNPNATQHTLSDHDNPDEVR